MIGAVAWVGAGTLFHITARRVIKAANEQSMRQFLTDGTYFASHYFIPVSMLTVATGLALVFDSDAFGFADPFVAFGLTVFVISFLMGAGYIGPQTGKLLARVEAGEFGSPGLTAKFKQLLMVSSIELLLLWATVVVMVVKPG